MAATIDGWASGVGSFLQNFVGITSHYVDIQRGVLDTHNILYFGSMSILFLILNTLSLQGRRYG